MKKTFWSTIAFLLLGTLALAQSNQPISVQWQQPDATPSEALNFSYRYYLDGDTTGVILKSILCGTSNLVTQCAAPLPSPSNGIHTIVLRAENEFGLSEPSNSLTFKYPGVPTSPVNVKVVK